jgi:cytochrome b pre-mRNA-processing protein 3
MFQIPFLRRKRDIIGPLFADIVAASRHPAAYREWQVADDFEGRFERLALVMVLVLRRLKDLPAPADGVGQDLVDRLFAHLDDGVRRIGVGDLSVGKKVKAMAQGFYGRAQALTAALDQDDEPALRACLARNLYGSKLPPDEIPMPALEEIATLRSALGAADLDRLLAGGVMARALDLPVSGG